MCEYCEVSDEGYTTNILYDIVPSVDYVDDLIFGAYVSEKQLILDCWKPNPF